MCYITCASCTAQQFLLNQYYLSRSTNNELDIFKFPPAFCFCLLPRYKYFRQHSTLVHPQQHTQPQPFLVFSNPLNHIV